MADIGSGVTLQVRNDDEVLEPYKYDASTRAKAIRLVPAVLSQQGQLRFAGGCLAWMIFVAAWLRVRLWG